jgi:glycosyltransferase involved in cell wall biosynthesis
MFGEPIRLAQFTNGFSLGGGEVQFVELLRKLPDSYAVSVAALEAKGPLLDSVLEMGHSPEVFELRGSAIGPNTLVQVKRFARWLRDNRIQLVHTHDLYTALIAVPAAKIARCGVIVGRLDLLHWKGRLRRQTMRALSRAADHVIANAKAIQKMLIEKEGIPSERVTVIYNGIDVAAFDRRVRQGPSLPLPETGRAPVAALVANMHDPVKRQEDFLLALSKARTRFPDLQAFLLGDGSRRAQLEDLAARLELKRVAHFLGRRVDVPAVLARSNIGVLCSEREGLSNAVMEGMAGRLPMIVTDTGGNPELVKDGERGFVVSVRQPSELSAAMVKLLENPQSSRRMGEAGRQFIEEEMGLSRMVRAHDVLYRSLLAEAPETVLAGRVN